eukprot:3630945-Pyramimonas_sp.AAC.1
MDSRVVALVPCATCERVHYTASACVLVARCEWHNPELQYIKCAMQCAPQFTRCTGSTLEGTGTAQSGRR